MLKRGCTEALKKCLEATESFDKMSWPSGNSLKIFQVYGARQLNSPVNRILIQLFFYTKFTFFKCKIIPVHVMKDEKDEMSILLALTVHCSYQC